MCTFYACCPSFPWSCRQANCPLSFWHTRQRNDIITFENFTVDYYVDAAFDGLYGIEDSQDPVCAKSRSGFILYLTDCPLLGGSKLQTEIASSTMEAEYIARIVQLVCDTILSAGKYESKMYSSVFEDNNGAFQLACSPRMTPRTKHYTIKNHFFATYVEKEEIKIFKISTKVQRVDIMTKGLVFVLFVYLQMFLCGW
jgi:hypothetical protein